MGDVSAGAPAPGPNVPTTDTGAPAEPAPVVLDTRSSGAFEAGHVPTAYSIPWAEIGARTFELPPRDVPLIVCAGDDVAAIEGWFETRTVRCLWQVTVVNWNSAASRAAAGATDPRVAQLFARELEHGPVPSGQFLFPLTPLLRESTKLLARVRSDVRGRQVRALDIGAGSGRDAILLAADGWEVTALDRDARALARFSGLAERQGCAERCTAVHAVLTNEGDLVAAVGNSAVFDVINVCRHHHRPTLVEIGRLLAPGGVLLYHTFAEGTSHPTDPKKILQPTELAHTFEGSLTVLRDEVCTVEDGRPLSFFVARRAIAVAPP